MFLKDCLQQKILCTPQNHTTGRCESWAFPLVMMMWIAYTRVDVLGSVRNVLQVYVFSSNCGVMSDIFSTGEKRYAMQ